MSRESVIGIDASLRSTGIAVVDGTDCLSKIFTTTIGYSLDKEASQGAKVARWLDICRKIIGVATEYNATVCGIEFATFGNVYRALELSELVAVIRSQHYIKFGFSPIVLTPSTIRKCLLGKDVNKNAEEKKAGKTAKKDVEEYFRANGCVLKTADEYDALAIAKVLWDNRNGNRMKMSKGVLKSHQQIDSMWVEA